MGTNFITTTNQKITSIISGQLSANDIPEGNIKTIEIGTSITSLGDNCFSNLQYLKNVVISKNVISIGENCFSNSTITSLRIPSNVSTIGNNCFNDCSQLVSIVFDNIQNLTNIGENLFNEDIRRTITLYNASSDNNAVNAVPSSLKIQLDKLTKLIINYLTTEYKQITISVKTVLLSNKLLKITNKK